MPGLFHHSPIFLGDILSAERSAIPAEMGDEADVSWISGASHLCSAFRKVRGEKDDEEISICFRLAIFGQAIFYSRHKIY